MRFKLATAAATAILTATAITSGVQAADLLIVEPTTTYKAPHDLRVYALLYGGYVTHATLTTYDEDGDPLFTEELEHGWGFGGAIGVVVMEGLSVELDVFHTNRPFADADGHFNTTSVMANLKGTAPLNEIFEVYAGAGLGMIGGLDTVLDLSGWGAGYQFMVGANVNVTDNIAIFGELRHQNTFQPVAVDHLVIDSVGITGTNAILGGFKVSM